MELFKACSQWATRPVDERFWTLEEARRMTKAYADTAEVLPANPSLLRVAAHQDDLYLDSATLPNAKLSNYAFGQLCQKTEPRTPTRYLQALPTTLAAQNLNFGLKHIANQDKEAQLLFHLAGNGFQQYVMRAATSDIYSRIWNHNIFSRLEYLETDGWRVPPARPAPGINDPRARQATADDLMNQGVETSLSVGIGDMIAPAGIYASDHDMFVFMVNEDRQVDEHLSRGFFIWNSEVGDKSFGFCRFYYNHVCGNHIVWGAEGVIEFRMRHVGNAPGKAFQKLAGEMRKYSDESASDDEYVIAESKKLVLGPGKEQVLAVLLGITKKKKIPLSADVIGRGYDVAERREDRYGNPNTMWAMVNGITEVSQEAGHANRRNEIDRSAGKLLSLAVA